MEKGFIVTKAAYKLRRNVWMEVSNSTSKTVILVMINCGKMTKHQSSQRGGFGHLKMEKGEGTPQQFYVKRRPKREGKRKKSGF